ncbi:hypothetical protein SAMN04488500_101214 [Sporomusa malonica]|uniref:Wadjet protein JetD C-terminal domain-containing protein n=1 Tax=Sporomusa malonica TaxID=112901 RepID=A0A1W1YBD1_9FIRM|nr:hypothetical protein SAMN04488500_101214 [Sporomusa malonica]
MEIFLKQYTRVTVTLAQLEQVSAGWQEYREFAGQVERLITDMVLTPIAACGTNQANPPLPLKYRVNKLRLCTELHERIREKQLVVHSLIQLEPYFKSDESLWRKEAAWIDMLHTYLSRCDLPLHETSVWERSYEIAGDEKWISEGGGYAFLQRVGLYGKLNIVDIAEPLMFALNPGRISDPICLHLIIENKTTFDILASNLPETDFLTMIYGAGKGFLSGIGNLEWQLHLTDRQHRLFYFGDLDQEGITIWYLLNSRRPARLALAFYQALLAKEFTKGKENQRQNDKAYASFLSYFPGNDQDKLRLLFAGAGYYPQEALAASELGEIARKTPWKSI